MLRGYSSRHREAVEEAFAAPVGEVIASLRGAPERLTFGQIAARLSERCAFPISENTVRVWWRRYVESAADTRLEASA